MRIYLDHAATTPLDNEVLSEMMPYFSEEFGNASAVYREGQKAREALDDSRLTISQILECSIDEVLFTSGATESNNLVIKGVLESWKLKNPGKKPEIISSPLEHSSVKKVLDVLAEKNLIKVIYVSVDKTGIVNVEEIKEKISENTILVSIQAINSEIGTIQPVARIGRICSKAGIPFHIDAVQAVGQIQVSCLAWKCDFLSLSAHKFYGPKGTGVLFARSGTEISPQIIGGGHERNFRSGTENIPGVVGTALAFKKANEIKEEESKRLKDLQIWGKKYIEENIPNAIWNGPDIGENRICSNIHFSFGDINGESLLMRLDMEGVSVSLGSACSSGLTEPSGVLIAIGQTEENARSGVRITMGRSTTDEKLQKALEILKEVVISLQNPFEGF